MTVVFIDPAGPLTNTNEVLDVTTNNLATSISVEFQPHLGTGKREAVFDGTRDDGTGGDFSYLYRKSTREGAGPYTYRIRRQGVWPSELRLRVTEGPPASGLPPTASLQPTIYSPIAQWALQGATDPTPARVYLDRSGNARHLTQGSPTGEPDLIPGQTAIRPNSTGDFTTGNKLRNNPADAVIAAVTEFTITSRIKWDGGGGNMVATISSNYTGAASNSTNMQFQILSNSHPLYSYSPNAAGFASYEASTLACPVGQWVFFTMRRFANGDVRFGLGANYETLDIPGLPVSGTTNARMTIGDDGDSSVLFNGLIADVCLWGTALTDDELTPLRIAAMGP